MSNNASAVDSKPNGSWPSGVLELGRRVTRRLRWLILGVVVLLLLWPTSKTENLIAERAARRDSVTREVLGSYGRAQTITGPILTVPYRVPEQYNRNRFKIEYARFLPASLEVRGRIDADVRHRSIFEVPVYVAEVELRGHFDPPTVKAPAFDNAPDNAPGNASDNASDKPANPSSGAKPDNIVWDQATVAAELSDKKGLMEPIVFQAMGKRFTLETGDDGANPFKHGMLATIDSALAKNGMDFTMRVKARGGERFAVLPPGGEPR